MNSQSAAPQDAAALRVAYTRLLARAPEDRVEPRLDPVRRVCELLGDPERAYPVIQVTGTNGKTSTSRMIETILREHQLRTGLLTSPHLESVTERIVIDGLPVPDAVFAERWHEIEPYLYVVDGELERDGQPGITFFEALVLLGFAAFADAPVEVAVVEVGMGGSWDASNVVDAQIAVVTPVALDHEKFLGSSIAEIAGEKAGIIKAGSVAVLARQSEEAAEVLLERAREMEATVLMEGRDFGVTSREIAVGGQLVGIQGVAASYDNVLLPLHGEHQAHNLAAAIVAAEIFLGAGKQAINGEVLTAAMAAVSSPGRLEVVRRGPTVLVDAAHNPAGAAALAVAVPEAFRFSRLIGVVGVLADKDARGLLEVLEPLMDEIVLTQSSSPRSLPPPELFALALDIFGEDRVFSTTTLSSAVDLAIERAEMDGDLSAAVLATGSVLIAGEVRGMLMRP